MVAICGSKQVESGVPRVGRSADRARSNPAQVASYQRKLTRTGVVVLECLKSKVKLGFTNPLDKQPAKAQVEKGLLEEGLHRSPSRVRSRSESGSGSAELQVELHGYIKAITAHFPTHIAILHLI